jgi:AcrR family transcriptional regulator
VDRTTLDDVMGKSGVSKSQLYHYFADKDALVLEVITLQSERVMTAQQPHFGGDGFFEDSTHMAGCHCPAQSKSAHDGMPAWLFGERIGE